MIVSVQYCTVLYSTVQYCTVLDLGPCFGMNGHFRRDPDVISRLPESTIDFLSVFIGFRNLSKVFFDFVPGIILDHFSNRQ
mgnify:CR=1 FL=1